MTHKCYCGVEYECPWCGTSDGYICPTVNGDEDSNMCDDCLDKFAKDYQEWYDKEQV